jgi:hypothetical protein
MQRLHTSFGTSCCGKEDDNARKTSKRERGDRGGLRPRASAGAALDVLVVCALPLRLPRGRSRLTGVPAVTASTSTTPSGYRPLYSSFSGALVLLFRSLSLVLSHPPRNVRPRLAASPSLGPRLESVMAAIGRRGEEGVERVEEGGRESERSGRGAGAVESRRKSGRVFFWFRLLLSTWTSRFFRPHSSSSTLSPASTPKAKLKNTTCVLPQDTACKKNKKTRKQQNTTKKNEKKNGSLFT